MSSSKFKIFFNSILNLIIIVKFTWNYGGNEVYIIGSFTNWDYMIKLHKTHIGLTPVFEISMVRYILVEKTINDSFFSI